MMKRKLLSFCAVTLMLGSCAPVDVPGARNLNIPAPAQAEKRAKAVNERPDAVMYLPLGEDVLVPEVPPTDALPDKQIGPFELRSETVAGALQLILSDYEIPLAFETEDAMSRTVTVSNMRGPVDKIVRRICALGDVYCAYEDGILTVKETQTFTVSVPPVGGDTDIIDTVAAGIQAITGQAVITDTGTRTIIYEATQRSSELVDRYFQRMRSSTALIVFEVYIWEVTLNGANATGIDWQQIASFGTDFSTGINIPGTIPADFNPISIGLPTKGDVDFGTDEVFRFISQFGAVKTISQPQITMLSGAQASLRAADTINYVSSLERTIDDGDESVSTQTDSVDTGFTLTLGSNWDNATVYSNIDIELQTFQEFDDFDAGAGNQIRLPITTERQLITQVRVRPGDSLLIAGLVREADQFDTEGPGIIKPIIPTNRSVSTSNVELVFLMRPRVIVYTADKESGPVEQKKVPQADISEHDVSMMPVDSSTFRAVEVENIQADVSAAEKKLEDVIKETANDPVPVPEKKPEPMPNQIMPAGTVSSRMDEKTEIQDKNAEGRDNDDVQVESLPLDLLNPDADVND